MTPKEKAEELVGKYKLINYDLDDIENHKECALIAVDEILQYQQKLFEAAYWIDLKYWQEVKQEIEKL
jgi:hypothetical protein